MGVEAMITIIDYGFVRKKYSVQKVHTHGTLIQVSVLEAKKYIIILLSITVRVWKNQGLLWENYI